MKYGSWVTLKNAVENSDYSHAVYLICSWRLVTAKQVNRVRMLIADTIAHYGDNPRAVDGESCAYIYDNGKRELRCAVGRCFTSDFSAKFREKIRYNGMAVSVLEQQAKYYGFNMRSTRGDDKLMMRHKYRNIPSETWCKVQGLHDNADHWVPQPDGGNVLSVQGLDFVSNMMAELRTIEDAIKYMEKN